MKFHPRRPWLAAALTLLVPGLGQLYAGEVRRAGAVWLGYYGLLAGLLVFKVPGTFPGLIVFLLAVLSCFLWVARDAFRLTGRSRSAAYVLQPFNRWYLYLAITVASNLLASQILVFSPVRAFRLASASMAPSILEGDRVYADLSRYRGSTPPARGDVVLYQRDDRPEVLVVARVIGLEGERIEVRDKKVIIDGRPLADPWAYHNDSFTYPVNALSPGPLRQRDQYPALTIPSGSVFLMGDSRDNSYDSRFLGPVPLSALRGRLLYVYWSADWSRIGRSLR